MSAVAARYVRFTYSVNGPGSVDLKYIKLLGLDEPDQLDPKPEIINDPYIDASADTQFKGFRRRFSISLFPVAAHADRLKLLNWAMSNDRTIDYNTGTYAEAGLCVVPVDAKSFMKSIWLNNYVGSRAYNFDLVESLVAGGSPVRTAWPV